MLVLHVLRRFDIRGALAIGLLVAFSVAGAATARTERPPPLVGTWQRVTTCTELVTALRKASLQKFVLEFVAGNGFIPGVKRPGEIANPAKPCVGAVPRKHSHFFTKARAFGSRDWTGQPVDDGTYRLVGRHAVVISKEFPKVTFHYRIQGSTIKFTPVLSAGCKTFRCAWAISMAYPGKTWTRAR